MSNRNVKLIFGNAVKEKRIELGFSQEKLAEASGLHRTYVSDVERGTRNLSIESIDKLSRALELPVSSLFQRAGYGAAAERVVEILLVEDDLQDLQDVRGALRKANLTNPIKIARNTEEALECLFGQGTDLPCDSKVNKKLILLDLELPRWEGLRLLKRIKSDARTRMIPVIALTSSKEQNEMVECHQLEVNGFIIKPVTFERFIQAVQKLGWRWMLLHQPAESED